MAQVLRTQEVELMQVAGWAPQGSFATGAHFGGMDVPLYWAIFPVVRCGGRPVLFERSHSLLGPLSALLRLGSLSLCLVSVTWARQGSFAIGGGTGSDPLLGWCARSWGG